MKVGILTPHSQLNYGGVLQAWAMLESLSSIPGVEAVFLDWWADKDNVDLDRGVSKWSLRRWLGEIVRAMLGLGNGSFLLRQWRTRRMMRRSEMPDIETGRMERLRRNRGEMSEAEYLAAYSTGRERVVEFFRVEL